MGRRKHPKVIVDRLPPEVQHNESVGLDIEGFEMDGKRLHRPTGRFASLQICVKDTVYVLGDIKMVLPALKRVRHGRWGFHHAGFDLKHLRSWTGKKRYLSPPVSRLWDTMLIEQLLWGGYYPKAGDGGHKGAFALPDLTRRYFGVRMDKDIRKQFETATKLDRAKIAYGADDAWYTRRIMDEQLGELAGGHPAAESFDRVWNDIEGPMIYVLLDWKGVLIDEGKWRAMAQTYYVRMQEIRESVGFNPGSNPQTIARLHAEGFAVKNAQAATMEDLKDVSETARIRLDYKEAEKRYGTYGMRWANDYIEDDGRVYCDYSQIGTVTSRLASSKPNLQNIPVRSTLAYRRCFIAAKGNTLLVLDFEQQEPRITAFRSQDANLLKALRKGQNPHVAVARAVFKDASITKKHPRYDKGKAVNLALVYGMTPRGLASTADVSEYEAEILMREYFDNFPGVATMIAKDQAFAETHWYIQAVDGRVVHINCYFRRWHNLAANYPIQTSGAALLKRCMVLLWELCKAKKVSLPLVLNVHDELVLEIPTGTVTFYKKLVREACKQAAHELCPGLAFPVEMHTGKTWAVGKGG